MRRSRDLLIGTICNGYDNEVQKQENQKGVSAHQILLFSFGSGLGGGMVTRMKAPKMIGRLSFRVGLTLEVANNYYRPDLKKAALARLSVVNRSLRVAKSGVKKRNRQAVKIVD
ncbi:hypothetical protein JHK84_050854 [Glycine max]|nr:hypothetical protein JHK84_050854 [Glycine max]